MLTIKFFQVNDNYYANIRHDGNLTDRESFYNVSMDVADFIKKVLTWGYSRVEITFIIDPTCAEYETAEINRAIETYAD